MFPKLPLLSLCSLWHSSLVVQDSTAQLPWIKLLLVVCIYSHSPATCCINTGWQLQTLLANKHFNTKSPARDSYLRKRAQPPCLINLHNQWSLQDDCICFMARICQLLQSSSPLAAVCGPRTDLHLMMPQLSNMICWELCNGNLPCAEF